MKIEIFNRRISLDYPSWLMKYLETYMIGGKSTGYKNPAMYAMFFSLQREGREEAGWREKERKDEPAAIAKRGRKEAVTEGKEGERVNTEFAAVFNPSRRESFFFLSFSWFGLLFINTSHAIHLWPRTVELTTLVIWPIFITVVSNLPVLVWNSPLWSWWVIRLLLLPLLPFLLLPPIFSLTQTVNIHCFLAGYF